MAAKYAQGVLEVDGSSIYYERRGQGPALLMIAGAGGDAGFYGPTADELADEYTVLTYDRRGNSRSKWRGPVREFSLLEHASDAVALINANGFEAATVFGQSGGALLALVMMSHYPHAVDKAMIHEPPALSALAGRGDFLGELLTWYDHLEQLGVQGKPEQAGAEFVRRCGLEESLFSLAGSESFAPVLQRFQANMPYFVTEEMQVFTYFRPDYPRLRATDVPLQIGIGHRSLNMHGVGRPVFYAQATQALADRIGASYVEFAGDHIAFMTDPVGFANRLREVLKSY